ncbi:hypothetical protein BH11MYX4_BH11MYX4_10480 [soil metagenome]
MLLSLALASAGVYALACGEDASGGGGGGGNGGDGGGGTLPEAAVGKTDADAPATTMRLAHVAADLGPVEFCYRAARSTSFEGPVLGGGIGDPKRDGGDDGGGAVSDASLDAADAGASAVGYRTVSRYLTLGAAGPLTLALVAPGSTSCASPLLFAYVTLDPGKLATVAIVGLGAGDGGAAECGLVAFIDDRTTVPSEARVRMVNAAFGTAAAPTTPVALAVRAVGAQTITLAERVEPKKAGSPSTAVPVDALGYATIGPLPSPAQLAVGAAADTKTDAGVDSWVSTAGELHLQGGSLHTGFVLTGEDAKPFEVLWCTDTSTSGDRTTCELVR